MADTPLKQRVRAVKQAEGELAGAMESLLIAERVGVGTKRLYESLRAFESASLRAITAINDLNALLGTDPDNPMDPLIEGEVHELP